MTQIQLQPSELIPDSSPGFDIRKALNPTLIIVGMGMSIVLSTSVLPSDTHVASMRSVQSRLAEFDDEEGFNSVPLTFVERVAVTEYMDDISPDNTLDYNKLDTTDLHAAISEFYAPGDEQAMTEESRSGVEQLRNEILSELRIVKSDLAGEIKALDAKLSGELQAVRGEIQTVKTELSGEIRTARAELSGRIDKLEDRTNRSDKLLYWVLGIVSAIFLAAIANLFKR
ncbi:hypothetical protein [Alicyclobacillus sendaiensis]|uniref:hypothetical protein n=1 Tax=Alicyclobacillus sendaiensis TaxID=192387 RepID=UPI0026F46A2C|nr:hypothetical protein [Alicyclobacillus sendaiensis]